MGFYQNEYYFRIAKILMLIWYNPCIVPFPVKAPVNSSWNCNNTDFYEREALRPQRSFKYNCKMYTRRGKETLHFHYMCMPLYKNLFHGGHEIYNFGRPFHGHHYNILICLIHTPVFKRTGEEKCIFSIYDLYGYTFTLGPLPRGSWNLQIW